jgi:PhnB protein
MNALPAPRFGAPENRAEVERLFEASAERDKVVMPLTPTFWAARFGMCVGRFGVPRMVNCESQAQS